MVSKGVVPKYGDLITATYAVLKALGGSGKNEEINEKVAELLALSDEVLEIPQTNGSTASAGHSHSAPIC